MHLGRRNPHKAYYMTTDGGELHKLDVADTEKDLGVHIDSKLTFSYHIQQKVNKANKMLGYIRHTFKHIDTEAFLLLYKSLVRPHLEYASTVWSPHLKYLKDSIERVQRRATKLVPSIRHLTYTERLQKLDLETLEYR